ncbi:MAG: 2-oxo acid dehydrogenase subunit E2 [Ignavibacteriales bacterium]|nr:2-oxo acid dehydrogenase subunit E2 [Ignavibacteriales bacterium]
MQVEVVMPKMGESIQEGKILRWLKKPGDTIGKDETILEISTDKVDSEIPSPSAGVLTKIIVPEGDTVDVGTVIAMIETDAASAKIDVSQTASPHPTSQISKQEVGATTIQEKTAVSKKPSFAEIVSGTVRPRNGNRFYSPLVRSIAKKEGVALEELDQLAGSGMSGRVTKNDILDYLTKRTLRPISVSPVRHEAGIHRIDIQSLQKKYPAPLYEIVQMDNVQIKMAEHMVKSVQTSPHVQAISECDVSGIVNFRAMHAERFEKQEGYKLTFTPFFIDATIRALKEFPVVNSSIEGDKIIYKKFINFGMAVAAPTGLIVPVMRNAEAKNFLDIARAINDLAVRTRNRKLTPDEIQGGTFTITNYGVFGNTVGIPIINQPQVAILGVGAIKKRPVVVTDASGTDAVAIRSIAYLTLSFDHRIIDGAIGGQFLAKVISNIEQFDFKKAF